MRVECLLDNEIKDRERVEGHKITEEEISKSTGVDVDTINRLRFSHIESIDNITIGDISKLCDFFNIKIEKFLVSVKKTKSSKNNSRKIDSNKLKELLEKSDYKDIYISIPGLINELSNILDTYSNVTVGINQNISLKLVNERVIVRFTSHDGKIKINNCLFGTAISTNGNSVLYKDIYKEYKNKQQKDYIENKEDVAELFYIIRKYINNI